MMNDNEYLLAGSEELSRKFNELGDYYSDFYKDVYGFRPRGMALCADQYANEAELLKAMEVLREEIADLEQASREVWAEEQAARQKAIEAFEAEVAEMMALKACDRREAIDRICIEYNVDVYNEIYGWEELEYVFRLPFGYIKKSLA